MLLPIYSRRKRLANKEGADVYQYEVLSEKLCNQILFTINRWDRTAVNSYDESIYRTVVEVMREELGVSSLALNGTATSAREFESWFLSHDNLDDMLDGIELCVQCALALKSRHPERYVHVEADILQMNARMLEAGFGFQIENGRVIQISSSFAHQEITVPSLAILAGSSFQSANEEFRHAYQEFNQGNYDDCIHDCCNAFESVLKVILTEKGWTFSPNDTAKKLLAVAFENGLIPLYMQNEFTGLRTILESGVPTVRNKDGGHGAGAQPRVIPKHIAAFQLHQTAAAILLLAQASSSSD